MKTATRLLPVLLLLAAPAFAQQGGKEMAESVNRFGIDLYEAVSHGEENLFLSPYSVSVALAMTREGARGQTAEQMDAVLHFPKQRLGEHYRALLDGLAPRQVEDRDEMGRSKGKVATYQLQVANRLFGQKGYPFVDGFTSLLKDVYGAPLERIDYGDSAAARQRINAWVAENTKDKIKNIVPPGLPTGDTRLTLANAIYFKASWFEPFKERNTKQKPFHGAGGQVQAKLMHRVDHYHYAEDDAVQVLELTYRGHDTSMVVVLPKQRDGLKAVEESLSHEKLAGWLGAMNHTKVDVQLPRFEFTAPLNLGDTLKAMGMPLAFDPSKADFSGMTGEEPLFIGAVLHKAFVAVDEAGTEAAAATVVMMMAGSAPRPELPKPFVADHPFLFLIRHRKTGCILFMGRLTDPTR
jgi:serpin B